MITKNQIKKSIVRRNPQSEKPSDKDAVRVAMNYLKRMLNVSSILLEEIDQTKDGKDWLITLSHEKLADDKRKKTINDYLTIPLNRSYRVIRLDKKTGMIQSMKIREI